MRNPSECRLCWQLAEKREQPAEHAPRGIGRHFVPEVEDDDLFWHSISPAIDRELVHVHLVRLLARVALHGHDLNIPVVKLSCVQDLLVFGVLGYPVLRSLHLYIRGEEAA